MKKSLRLALLAGASFIALAFAGEALAAYDPSLQIEQSSYKLGAPATVDVFIAAGENDDPTAKLTIFSPSGYSANLSAAPGTKIGKVAAFAKLLDLGGAIFPVAGDVLVANPTTPGIQQAAARCTPGITNDTIWVLNTSLQGQSLSIPVFVKKVGPYVTQVVCLSPPDVPAGTPGRAPLGAKLVAADFTIQGVFSNAGTRGGYEWAGVFTPYVPGAGTPNVAATVQWRTYVGLPTSLTLKRAKARRGLKFVGRLLVAGLDPRTIRLNLYAGRKARPAPNATSGGTGRRVARSARLPRSGKYSITRRAVKVTTFFQMRFENYLTECNTTLPGIPPVRCTGEFLAAVTSNQVRVLKRRR